MKEAVKHRRGFRADKTKLIQGEGEVEGGGKTQRNLEREERQCVRPRKGDGHGFAVTPHLSHPFRADFNDHFETSIEALRDVAVVVNQLRHLVRPSSPEEFTVYDPYYCAGTVVHHWRALGVERVVHENRDFYNDIAEKTVPSEYDMLVTNPPFSGDHIQKLFDFLVLAKKPFAFLVPDYTATKSWYKEAVRLYFTPAPTSGKGDINAPRWSGSPNSGALMLQPPPFVKMENETNTSGDSSNRNNGGGDGGVDLPIGTEPFYLVPHDRYDFAHVKGVGNEHSHFRSMWFVWAGRHTSEVLRGVSVEFARMRNERGQQRVKLPEVVHGLDALAKGHRIQTGSRPNPQRRKGHRQHHRN